MMNNQFYELWGNEIHSLPKQIKSIEKARLKATTPNSVDCENQVAIFPGSKEPYYVTLSFCPCGSFRAMKKPCKHMYRLAMELGLFDGSFEAGVNKNSQLTLEDAVAELENLTDVCQILIKDRLIDVVYRHIPESVYEYRPEYEPLKKCPLVCLSAPSASAIKSFGRAVDIINACVVNGFEVPESLCSPSKKTKLSEWCSENAPGAFLSFSFADNFVLRRKKVCTYLKRKYDFREDDESIPYGAECEGMSVNISIAADGSVHSKIDYDKTYHFPDDEITHLLDLYGHNRCNNSSSCPEEAQ